MDLIPKAIGRNVRRVRGFSLVELMVVLVIIGLLASVATVNVHHYLVKAKQNTAKMEISNVCGALETFYTAYDRYPTNEEGLAILTQKSERISEPLLKQTPVDPWSRAYQYNQPGRQAAYEVVSYGADGREGGEGADTDIVSWNLKQETANSGSTAKP